MVNILGCPRTICLRNVYSGHASKEYVHKCDSFQIARSRLSTFQIVPMGTYGAKVHYKKVLFLVL